MLFNFCLIAALRHTDSPAVGAILGSASLGLAMAGPLTRAMRPGARLTTAAAIVVAGTVIVNGAAFSELDEIHQR